MGFHHCGCLWQRWKVAILNSLIVYRESWFFEPSIVEKSFIIYLTAYRCLFFSDWNISYLEIYIIVTGKWGCCCSSKDYEVLVFSGLLCCLPFVLVSFLYFAEMSRMPKFRRHREGFLILGYTREADEVFKRSKESNDKQSVRSKALEEVIWKIISFFKHNWLAYFLALLF